MPASETYNPARAAKQVGIPASTLRLWAKTYAEFLSPESNPAPGTERRFTDLDVEMLRAVAQLRANDLQPAEIIARLRANPTAPLQNATETPATPVKVVTDLDAAQNAVQTFLAHAGNKLDDVASKIDGIDDRLQRVEHRRDIVIVAIAAFAAGAVVVAIIVWLVVSIMR